MRHLADAWLRLARRVGARDDVAGAGAALLGRWAEPHRGYHDLAHLSEVLERVDLLADEAGDADLVRLAAWFHDAVYDPTAADNEDRSLNERQVEYAGTNVAVLASDGPRYTAYVDGVRREYGHLSDADFASGRAAVLRRLLDRPELFRTAFGNAHWEAPARANVLAELERLDAQ